MAQVARWLEAFVAPQKLDCAWAHRLSLTEVEGQLRLRPTVPGPRGLPWAQPVDHFLSDPLARLAVHCVNEPRLVLVTNEGGPATT